MPLLSPSPPLRLSLSPPLRLSLVLSFATLAPLPAAAPAKAGRDLSYNTITQEALSPEAQRASFQVPPGFEVELVAAESEGAGKFITVVWDARMRLWTMTAFEYPVDGNENKTASDALFARGGRDRVLVFDHPYAPTPEAPRVFADGLVMPLGLLPYRDGAFVQYGPDIRLYRDTDQDGRADRHDVILTGFGTQDSHLFPHQFLRQPGGMIFVAQGLFNYSTVRRPEGQPFADGAREIPFNQCKLARFSLDGAHFENVTAGPNNIWGLVTARDGESFLQEANDLGYPVIPYTPGIYVRTGSKDLLRPYQPLMPPPLAPAQMGGTGLSGLALAEDQDDFFRRPAGAVPAGTRIFYLANPITGTVQIVQATPDGPRYRYEKRPDFLTTTDRWFRPVAVHFGPDGALYIVDWYNKIISHNEVPRNHPDRDKTRGRIWRVRHRDQARMLPPDLTRLDDRALLAQLAAPNALVARLAWLEITDRRATGLAPDLLTLAGDRKAAVDQRLGALWALEGLQAVPQTLLNDLASDTHAALRREVARILGAHPRSESEFIALAERLVDDPHPAVRAALGDSLRRPLAASARLMAIAARLGRAPLDKTADEWTRYERDFERYLARWAMERHPSATRTMLESPEGQTLPLENRVLATLALGGRDSAVGLARLAPALSRPLAEEEIRTLATHFRESEVRTLLGAALADPAARTPVLRALLALRTSIDTAELTDALATAAKTLLSGAAENEVLLGAEVAGAFKLAGAVPAVVAWARRDDASPPLRLSALRALRENQAGPVDLLESLAVTGSSAALRDEALATLAASIDPAAPACLVQLLPGLAPAQRGRVLDRLASSPAGAAALLSGIPEGKVARADLGIGTVDKLRTLLPHDAQVAALWQQLGAEGLRVLRLNGGNGDLVATQISLAGPFTVECWVKLDAPITNTDGILGAPGQFSLNFHASQLRLWLGGGARDIVMAKKKTVPGAWTHYAVTRDAAGIFRLYYNGELDATSTASHTGDFTSLDIGRVLPSTGGTAGSLAEFRVWRVARTAAEIRANFDRTFAGDPARPETLAVLATGAEWGPLRGQARVELAEDAPTLLTAAEAAAQVERFKQFRVLATARGNPEHGQALFTTICLACHQQGGKGGQLAPALDGVGLTGVDALLRNILTPSAAMESAYRIFRVVTTDQRVHEGFVAEDTPTGIVLRTPGAEDRRIPRSEIREAAYLRRSLMPEGLLEALPPEHVSDLFAYLRSLK